MFNIVLSIVSVLLAIFYAYIGEAAACYFCIILCIANGIFGGLYLKQKGTPVVTLTIDLNHPHENEILKFIWGLRDYKDVNTESEADLYTENALMLVYNKESGKFLLSIILPKDFDNYKEVCEYFQACLKSFTSFMDRNGYKKDELIDYKRLITDELSLMSDYDTIEEAYAVFKMYVVGYCKYLTE